MIDLLFGYEDKHTEIIEQSIPDESPAGTVRLTTRDDLIWMKQVRGSKTDQADYNADGNRALPWADDAE